MIDLIISIPGPKYLLYYAAFSAAMIILSKLIASCDGTGHKKTPSPAEFDPFELAFMNGGSGLVIQTAVFRLWNAKMIELAPDASGKNKLAAVPASPPRGNDIEEAVYSHLAPAPLAADQILYSPSLLPRIDGLMKETAARLEKEMLIRDEAETRRVWFIWLFCLFALFSAGAVKIALGLYRGKNVGFLVGLTLVSLFASYFAVGPHYRTTVLGGRLIASSKDKFGWALQNSGSSPRADRVDPAFLLAVFGAAFMSGSAYEPLKNFFTSEGSDGGCSGSSCGGSGCGGGGCGGGCGGCGGG